MVFRHEFPALAMCAALVVSVPGQVAAAEPAAKTPAPASSATTSGQRVAIDPATGRMRAPTAAEAAELDQQDRNARARQRLQRSRAQATTQELAGVDSVAEDGTFTTPSGVKGVMLDESQMVYSVVTRGADGSLNMECVDGTAAANKLLKRKAAPIAKKPVPAPQGGSYETK